MTKINDESSLPKLSKDSRSDMLSTLYVYELKESSKELKMLNDLRNYLIKTLHNKTEPLNEIRREIFRNCISEEELSTLKSPISKRYKEISKELNMLYDYIPLLRKIYDDKRKLFNELPNEFALSLTKKGVKNDKI